MWRQQCKVTQIGKNQASVIQTKEVNKVSVKKKTLKEIEIYKLLDKEFKAIALIKIAQWATRDHRQIMKQSKQ